jgi:prepilin-type N-terminal cleavage/methylation domain-containing protein
LRKAFSLLELLIVVVIIGVVYTLVIPNFESLKEKKQALTLGSLKAFLGTIPHERRVDFYCIDECRECFIRSDGKRVKEYDNLFDSFLDSSVKMYTYNQREGFLEIEKQLYFKDEHTYEELCFAYTLDKTRGGGIVFVSFGEKIYDFTSAFVQEQTYPSLDAAQQALRTFASDVLQ